MILRDNSEEFARSFKSNPGDRFEVILEPKVEKDGTISLIENGKRDIKAEINSWKEHTDMSWILRQMAAGTYQPRTSGMYGDFTEAPKNMAEAMQIFIDAEREFYNLDLETRNKFDNDYKKWMVMASTDNKLWSDYMGFNDDIRGSSDIDVKGDDKE